MTKRSKCFVVIARHGANSFFPVDRASSRQGAERLKRAFQKKHPYKRFAVKNMCASFGDGAPAAAPGPVPAATPAAKPVAGWWPFGKKKPPAKKVNPMTKRMIWEPGKPSQIFGRSRRKRRRR